MASKESLNALTKDQLLQLAEKNNVEVNKSAKKDEVVAALSQKVSQDDVDAMVEPADDTDEVQSDPKDEGSVKARPQHQGHDPLARGERLYNDKNETSTTHYRSDESELNADLSPEEVEEQRADKSDRINARNDEASSIVNSQSAQNTNGNTPPAEIGADYSDRDASKSTPAEPTGADKIAEEHNQNNPLQPATTQSGEEVKSQAAKANEGDSSK